MRRKIAKNYIELKRGQLNEEEDFKRLVAFWRWKIFSFECCASDLVSGSRTIEHQTTVKAPVTADSIAQLL